MGVDYAWTYLKQTQLICTVCEQPCLCLSWSAVVMHALTWVFFVLRASCWCCTLAVALHQRNPTAGWAYCLHETTRGCSVFKCAHLKFTVYGCNQTYIHTHNFHKCSHGSVGLAQACPNNLCAVFSVRCITKYLTKSSSPRCILLDA